MKAFPHQFNQLDKLTEALELLNIMKADNRNVVDDKELGSELARYGIYNFRNLVTSVEDRLKVEMQKAPGDQGFRTAARDIRRFFKLSGLVTSTWNLAPRGREILDAKGRKYLRDALWRQAMIDLRLPDSDGNISHPYRFLLKLVGDYPGIQTKKLLLAFEAHDDSPEEYARISSMVPLSFEDIVAKMDVTKSSAANAIKILPAIAEQVGDIERSRHCFPNVMGLPSEDGDYEYLEGSSAPAPAKTPMEVDPEDISKVPDFGELNPNGSFDLSAANEIRKKRTIQHHKAVASIAKLIAEEGFKVFEYPYDCLGHKAGTGSLLIEVKTLDGTTTDEHRQSVKALGQLKFYNHFHVPGELKKPNMAEVAAYNQTPSVSMVQFMNTNQIISVWSNEDYWFTVDMTGSTVKLSPLSLLDSSSLG